MEANITLACRIRPRGFTHNVSRLHNPSSVLSLTTRWSSRKSRVQADPPSAGRKEPPIAGQARPEGGRKWEFRSAFETYVEWGRVVPG